VIVIVGLHASLVVPVDPQRVENGATTLMTRHDYSLVRPSVWDQAMVRWAGDKPRRHSLGREGDSVAIDSIVKELIGHYEMMKKSLEIQGVLDRGLV
jgi:hypothetical protein